MLNMHGRMFVILTLGLLLATSLALGNDAVRSEPVRNNPTMTAPPRQKTGSVTAANSGGFLNSMRDADDGEYVIFNSKGDPEAAVVVTKDAAKATEESNIRSIYEWMQRYIDKNKKAVTPPSSATPKKNKPTTPLRNYVPGYYAPPPFTRDQYNQYVPVPSYVTYRPDGFYESTSNDAQYQYGVNEQFYPDQREPPKVVKKKKPHVTHLEINGGGQKRPVNVYNGSPYEYQWELAQKVPKDKDVIRGAHTTPTGLPWPPARRLLKSPDASLRIPFFLRSEQVSVPQGFMRYANIVNDERDSVAVESIPETTQQVVAPSQRMIYRSWLEGQKSRAGGFPMYGSNVNYDDETLSAYLLSKFAPFVHPEAYRVKSVVKTKKPKPAAKKGPARFVTRKQVDEMVNGKRYTPRPQYYAVEAIESTPQMFSRYAPIKDGGFRFWQNDAVVSPKTQQVYVVDGVGHGNTRYDALKALTGGRDYLNVYGAYQNVAPKYGGAKYSTGYENRNSQSLRRANFPQLYLFPSVDRNNQLVSLYGGSQQQGVSPNGYVDVMRNVNLPPRYQLEVQKPVMYQAPNQGFTGYANDMNDQGRNVDYQSLFSFIRGMNGVSTKKPKIRQTLPTRKATPQYFTVDVSDNTGKTSYDNLKTVNGYSKAQIAKIIANSLLRETGGMSRFKELLKYPVEPWQQFRNSERSYSQYDQPRRETFALRAPVAGYGF